tara:strand:+ start:926 stop:1192 length:267 start_codon:yes stop_codon:yes gene_type:complete
MEYEYSFNFLKIKSSDKINISMKKFLYEMDDWFYIIEKKIIILRSKEYISLEIFKLLNVQSNILSEIDIFLSNNKIKFFKIEIIKKKI